MGAIVDCNICGVELFRLDPNNPKTITGEEICQTCGGRVEAAFAPLEALHGKFQEDLVELYSTAKADREEMSKLNAGFRIQAEELKAEMEEELKNLRANIVAGTSSKPIADVEAPTEPVE